MARYALTIFISAFLLFQVQPLIAKSILPWFGGGSSVWTTCMLFFQLLLLGGYAYAHLLSVSLSARRQGVVHMVLVLLSLALLPIVPSQRFKPIGSDAPISGILVLLLATVGGPYFILSSTGPLLQRWFSRLFADRSPYRLYSLSNVGSLLALLSYPFVIEPMLRLRVQVGIWSILYAVFAALVVACSLLVIRQGDTPQVEPSPDVESGSKEQGAGTRPGVGRMLLWLGLSAMGSAMLLATTNQMCIDVAVVPFLWVLPLSLYLLSFVICFDNPRWYDRRVYGLLLVLAAAAACWQLKQELETSIPSIVSIYSIVMFACCMTCHGELVSSRPEPRYLTLFYLLVALGGAVGGLLVAVVAPAGFTGFWEFHIALAGACGLTLIAWCVNRVWQGRSALAFWVWGLVSVIQVWLVIELVVRKYSLAFSQLDLVILLGGLGSLQAIGWMLTADRQWRPNALGLIWVGVTLAQVGWLIGVTQTRMTVTVELRQCMLLSVSWLLAAIVGFLIARKLEQRAGETLRRWLPIVGLQILLVAGLGWLWKQGVVSRTNLLIYVSGWVGIYAICLWGNFRRAGSFAREGVWFWFPALSGWLLMVMVLVKFVWQDHSNLVYKSRNFYGVLNVAIENDANGEYYSLMNGQIEHGTQYQDDYWRTQPTTYYGAGSAVDLAMRLHPRRRSEDPAKRALRVGIVGLGAGTIAAYGKPGDSFRFYEINRNVVNVAKQYFSYLEDSAAQTQVVVGDARVAMEQELASGGSHQFDVLAIDAFSSDAIPLHLLTRECSDLYRQHLAADGLLLIHISNRYLDLNPITLALAEYLGRKAVRIDSDDNVDLGIHSATWIVITANEAFLSNSEVQDAHWPWAEDQAKQMWTDDFASLWQVISY